MNKKLAAAAFPMLLLAGCSTPQPTPAQQQIIKQLEAINRSLETLAKETKDNRQSALAEIKFQASPDRGINLRALSAIKALPAKPTDDEIRRYVQEITTASANQNSFSGNDPQVALLRKIGPGRVAAWAPYLTDHRAYHLQYALPDLIGKEDKQEALKLFRVQPRLLPAILQNGWIDDAREEIFGVIASQDYLDHRLQNYLPQLCKTQQDQKRLEELFCQKPSLIQMYDAICKLPGVDAAKLAENAWKNQHLSANEWQRRMLAYHAARHGNVEALGTLVRDYCSRQPNSYFDQNILYFLSMATGQPLQPAILQKWYDTNKDRLAFDAANRRYQVKPQK